jgi:hypothetical protein
MIAVSFGNGYLELHNYGSAPRLKCPSSSSHLTVKLLKSKLSHFTNVEVSSIDGLQGCEADIVVFVTVRCNAHYEMSFLKVASLTPGSHPERHHAARQHVRLHTQHQTQLYVLLHLVAKGLIIENGSETVPYNIFKGPNFIL